MFIKYKLDRTFGPFGSSTGFFMMIGGLMVTYFSLFGIIIALLGAFAAFTFTCSYIDTSGRKIKHSDNLFGIIPTGKWIEINPDMKLGLDKSHRGYVAYIRGTQPIDIHYNDIRIILYDSNNRKIMPVMKFDSYKDATDEMENLSKILGLHTIN